MPKAFSFWKPKAPIPAEERVPVTILSGFLGSGKTTLLNHLLASGAAEDLAVLVNDLGEVNIDASLIKRSARTMKQPISGMVELTSGCICCSIQTELIRLRHLLPGRARRERRHGRLQPESRDGFPRSPQPQGLRPRQLRLQQPASVR